MEKRSKKRDAIIEAARELFFRFGLRKVSVDEICKASGVSKMTFYKYFSNKTELAKTMLDEMYERTLGEFWEVMYSDEIPFAEKMYAFLEMKVTYAKDASKDFMMDMYYSEDSPLKEYMGKWVERALKESVAMFSYAQKRGWMRKDLKPELMMTMMNRMIDTTRNEQLIDMYDSVQDLAREVTKFFLYGVFDESDSSKE